MNWTKTILTPSCTPTHLGFLWNTLEGTIALPEDKTTKVEQWAKQLIATKSTTQEALESLVGTLISTNPAVWQAVLHYRTLQNTLLFSLKKGRRGTRSVTLNEACINNLV